MIEAYGLRTHIWNNNVRSVLLLILFPVLLLVQIYGVMLLFLASTGGELRDVGDFTVDSFPTFAPFAIGAAVIWFLIAFAAHNAIINASTRAKPLTQSQEPLAYNLLENLCISRGMTMPRLMVMETPALNAFASGIRESNYQITLTRGLIETLDKNELEAVIAHELSHIRQKDVRVLIIAVIFVGIFAFVGEMLFRGMLRTNFPRTNNHRRSGGGNSGVLILVAFAIIALTYLFAVLVRFTLSRKREYMADAGAVELTKNPDAMIRALQKISGKPGLDSVPDEIREMAVHNPRKGFAGAFATHPPINKRVEALVKFAGGRVGTESRPDRQPTQNKPTSSPNRERKSRNPWRR